MVLRSVVSSSCVLSIGRNRSLLVSLPRSRMRCSAGSCVSRRLRRRSFYIPRIFSFHTCYFLLVVVLFPPLLFWSVSEYRGCVFSLLDRTSEFGCIKIGLVPDCLRLVPTTLLPSEKKLPKRPAATMRLRTSVGIILLFSINMFGWCGSVT